MKISLKSPEKEAARKTPGGSSASSRIPSQFLKAKRTSGSGRSSVPRTAEMALDIVEPRLSEESEEEELVIDEMRRRGRGGGREAGGGVVTQMIPSLGALQVRCALVQSGRPPTAGCQTSNISRNFRRCLNPSLVGAVPRVGRWWRRPLNKL